MYYGNSPYFWSWSRDERVSSCAVPTHNTYGNFCYDDKINKNFAAFYGTLDSVDLGRHPSFQWLDQLITLVPKWELENVVRKDSSLLPVLGTKIACPVTLYRELEKITLKRPKPKKSKFPCKYSGNLRDQNFQIVKSLAKEDYVESGDKMRMKCPFHDDNVASSYYHVKEGFHFCYVCKKKRYAIGRDLMSEDPVKFEKLVSENPRILDLKKKRGVKRKIN